ncbi:hypothetical protein Dimus_031942, partial [Dionaea muscipula]
MKGDRVSDAAGIQRQILEFFADFFGPSCDGHEDMDPTCLVEGQRLNDEQKQTLAAEFTARDVWEAVKSIQAEKTP